VFQLCKYLKESPEASILDVGKSYLSQLLGTHYKSVDTIGYPLNEDHYLSSKGVSGEGQSENSHIIYDLNSAAYGESIASEKKYDLIVFAETIEHIHHAPQFALYALSEILKDNGYILCQTPNAVALHKRMYLLFGLNPFEKIRFDPKNPGHIREYTRNELISVGAESGLVSIQHEYRDYFGFHGSMFSKVGVGLLKAICRFVPSFSRGQTIIYKKVGR
jgi:hypothetical protein